MGGLDSSFVNTLDSELEGWEFESQCSQKKLKQKFQCGTTFTVNKWKYVDIYTYCKTKEN